MGFYVADGRSITTKRGIVAHDSENPEITPKDLGFDPEDKDAVKAGLERLKELAEKEYLVEAEKAPKTKASAAPPAPKLDRSKRGNPAADRKAKEAKAGAKKGEAEAE